MYGALPPEMRRTQARLFNDPDSGYDVLVASDAVGMGLNLNIRRIIFHTMEKNDGGSARVPISISHIKQIAGLHTVPLSHPYLPPVNPLCIPCIGASERSPACASADPTSKQIAGASAFYISSLVNSYCIIHHDNGWWLRHLSGNHPSPLCGACLLHDAVRTCHWHVHCATSNGFCHRLNSLRSNSLQALHSHLSIPHYTTTVQCLTERDVLCQPGQRWRCTHGQIRSRYI